MRGQEVISQEEKRVFHERNRRVFRKSVIRYIERKG